jgi:UDP-N-acetylmuramoyl-L-alanyl-D-glutamate--2,6-diaminopimelate ligase
MMFNQLSPDMHRSAAHLRLSDIINDVPVVQMFGPMDTEIAGITTDSRAVRDRWCFVATEGEHVDGHRFIQQAIERSAGCIVLQRRQYEETYAGLLTASYCQHGGVSVLVVEDSRIACAILADRFHRSPASQLFLVGITGTNGKTTTAFLIKQILEAAGYRTGLIGTIEYHIGKTIEPARFTTPPAEELHALFARMTQAGCTAAVMEVSSHALALRRVHGLRFDITIFSNLTQDHLDFHGTLDAYRDAKRLLFGAHTKSHALINADDPAGALMGAAAGKKKRSYGTAARSAFRMTDVTASRRGTSFLLDWKGGSFRVASPMVGSFNAYNLAAAAAVGCLVGLDGAAIARALKRVRSVPGRFERILSEDGVLAIVDYSHTPDALEKAVGTARSLAGSEGRVLTVFGCGGDRDRGKRPIMGAVASRGSDLAIVTSDNPRTEDPDAIVNDILTGIVTGADVHVQPDRRAAIRFALKQASPGDVVLVAGKGHETYQIIGTRKRPFDDREIIRAYFESRRGGVAR